MELFYQQERDKSFLQACDKVRTDRKQEYLTISEIASLAIYEEAPSFFIALRSYRRIITAYKTGRPYKSVYPAKDLMYREIEKRYEALAAEEPLKASKAAAIIETQKAPRFYICEERAAILYYELLKK